MHGDPFVEIFPAHCPSRIYDKFHLLKVSVAVNLLQLEAWSQLTTTRTKPCSIINPIRIGNRLMIAVMMMIIYKTKVGCIYILDPPY